MKRYLQLNDIDAYREAFHLSNAVWGIVRTWGQFERDTIGKQFVRAVDSISANLAEGFGRFTKKEKIQFYRYSYGSITESLDWNEKAWRRKIVTKESHDQLLTQLKLLPKLVHQLIKFTNDKLTM